MLDLKDVGPIVAIEIFDKNPPPTNIPTERCRDTSYGVIPSATIDEIRTLVPNNAIVAATANCIFDDRVCRCCNVVPQPAD